MTPAQAARLAKVKALMSSPNRGEAAAAREIYQRLCAQYGMPRAGGDYTNGEIHQLVERAEDARQYWAHQEMLERRHDCITWLRANGYSLSWQGEQLPYFDRREPQLFVSISHERLGMMIAERLPAGEFPDCVDRLRRNMAQRGAFA